jgi:hypothetical protein
MKHSVPIYDLLTFRSSRTCIPVHLAHSVARDVADAGKGRQSGWLTA